MEPRPLDDNAARDLARRAYVPEHVPGLMTALSNGRAHLVDDHLVLRGGGGAILVGYPLDDRFDESRIEAIVATLDDAWRPERIAYVGPRLPGALRSRASAVESDRYYDLDAAAEAPARLLRVAARARAHLAVAHKKRLGPEHRDLIDAFRTAVALPGPVDRLYAAIPGYVAACPTASVLEASVLEARDGTGRLAARFVMERGAARFDAYLMGCRALESPVPHASDLLMAELIERARAAGKARVDLGLGVNDGIRRFKLMDPGAVRETCHILRRRLGWPAKGCAGLPPPPPGPACFEAYTGRVRPWMALFALWPTCLGWRHSVDREAYDVALRMGKRVEPLETVEEQVDVLDRIPIDRIVKQLNDVANWAATTRPYVKGYLAGDLETLRHLQRYYRVRSNLRISERDEILVDRIWPRLEREDVVALAGLPHVPGMAARFSERGATVEQVAP